MPARIPGLFWGQLSRFSGIFHQKRANMKEWPATGHPCVIQHLQVNRNVTKPDSVSADHPTEQQLRDFMCGALPAEEQMELETHIGQCSTCCELLENLSESNDDTLIGALRQFDTSMDFKNRPSISPELPVVPDELIEHSRYEIMEHIGSGGMGQVFRARHRIMDREVAIKVIKRQFMNDETTLRRFENEIKAAAKLHHPSIVSSFDAEVENDINLLVMEYIDGKKMSELVRLKKRLSIRHACHFARQIAQGLQHAFEKGLTHRDIKPQNLLVTSEGVVKIMDFGLAKFASETLGEDEESLTLEGESFGTPDYVAPEQVRNAKAADIRADIYSLGCTLYFMLTGRKVFPSGSVGEKLAAHLEKTPDAIKVLRDDLPDELCAIVEKMMHKDPEQRYQTPAEVADDLKPWCRKDRETTAETESENIAAAETRAIEDCDLESTVETQAKEGASNTHRRISNHGDPHTTDPFQDMVVHRHRSRPIDPCSDRDHLSIVIVQTRTQNF